MSATEQTDVRGDAFLSDSLSAEGPYKVHGVAIGPDETTTGMSGQTKFWPAEALEEAAETLAGKNIVKNHVNNDVDAVVGAVEEARYHPEHGVIYKGEVDDSDLAQKISRNRLDVSPRIIHAHVDELEENDDGALVVDEVKEFVNLALVPQGAAESNSIETGRSGMLSVSHEDLRQAFDDGSVEGDKADADDLDADEDLEIEDPVKSSEESAQESGEDLGCDGSCECDHDEEESDPEDEELEDDEDGDDGEESVLSELSVLGADSEDTTDIDLAEIEFLR